MILLLPAGLDCPRCGSWSVVMDAELDPVPRRGQQPEPFQVARLRLWWRNNPDAEQMLRPLWRCATCGFVYSVVTQELIAEHIAEVEEVTA